MQPHICRTLFTLTCILLMTSQGTRPAELTDQEFRRALEFSLNSLPQLPPSPSNRYSDNAKAVQLGKKFFFDSQLSTNGKVSCASCHQPDRQFQDDRPVGIGVSKGKRRTMALRGVQWSPWQFWDGRKDSLWSQALGPLEDRSEHNVSRVFVARHVIKNYAAEYLSIFADALPSAEKLPEQASPLWAGEAQIEWNALPEKMRGDINRVFANTGKAIAAYVRTLKPKDNQFDLYVERRKQGLPTQGVLSEKAAAGFRLFTGKGNCSSCHRGALFTDNDFHRTGVDNSSAQPPDLGRLLGASKVLSDPFNCRGPYSDAQPDQCFELEYLQVNFHTVLSAFKTPSLRGVSQRPPYMHAGQLSSLETVIDHYISAPDQLTAVGTGKKNTELKPLQLTPKEKEQLLAFLRML